MNQIFRRSRVASYMFLLVAIIFAVIGLYWLVMGLVIGAFKVLLAFLFAERALWGFSKPYVEIEADLIRLNLSLIKKSQEIKLEDIENIEFDDFHNRIEINKKDQTVKELSVYAISKLDREIFKSEMLKLNDQLV